MRCHPDNPSAMPAEFLTSTPAVIYGHACMDAGGRGSPVCRERARLQGVGVDSNLRWNDAGIGMGLSSSR